MVEQFLAIYIKKIIKNPQSVRVEVDSVEDNIKNISVYVAPEDTGKVIGKEGRMINAIRVFISGMKARDGFSYKITVRPNDR